MRGVLHPALLHILLHRAQTLAACSLRAVACSCGCCLSFCCYALGDIWLRNISSGSVYLLPRTRALVFRAHPYRGGSPLLCCSKVRALEPLRVVSRVGCIWICHGRPCVAPVRPLTLLLAAGHLSHNRVSPLDFAWVVSHQIRDDRTLRARHSPA